MAEPKTKKTSKELPGVHDNPFEDKKEGKETNPFLMKPTKSMKKAAKKQKKMDKKELKMQKKKKKKKNSQENKEKAANGSENAAKQQIVVKAVKLGPDKNQNQKHSVIFQSTSTLPSAGTHENGQQFKEKPTRQTMDSRRLGEGPSRSPLVENKRIQQLKTGRVPAPQSKTSHAPTSDPYKTPQYQYNPSQGRSGFNMAQSPAEQPRPRSLEFKPPATSSRSALSPVREYRTPSPLVSRSADQDKMYRTNSVSKKGKGKKKKRKIKKLLKKKKKEKNGKNAHLLDDEAVASQVVMRRRPEERLRMLQNEIDETKEIVRRSAVELVEKRNSQLIQLMENVEKLEESSHAFAVTAMDNRLKQQARVRCCGIGSKWKICWYICACETGVKRRKNKGQTAKNGIEPESHELLSPRAAADLGDDKQPYGTSNESQQPQQPYGAQPAYESSNVTETVAQVSPRPASGTHSSEGDKAGADDCSLRSKLGKLPQALRGSMPSLSRESMSGTLGNSNLSNQDSSSVNALHEIIKKREIKKREEKERKESDLKERRIKQYVEENYEDEELRKRAASLLKFD